MSYDTFASIIAAKRRYKRARTTKHFILEPCPKRAPLCAVCGRAVNDFSGVKPEGHYDAGQPLHPPGYQGNRCDYLPKSKTVRAFHYTCAWDSTLARIIQLRAP
jgi:hypothetical protein